MAETDSAVVTELGAPRRRRGAGSARCLAEGLPGRMHSRAEAPRPAAYAVFDCETTGTTPGVDEIVSLAVVRVDADGAELVRGSWLVRPMRPIPPEATAVHGLGDDDVAGAPRFAQIATEVLALLDGAVFAAHNAAFDLAMLQHAFRSAGVEYRPAAVACTLDAFRLLEPFADNHRLQSICERRGIALTEAHEALNDVLATLALLRVLLREEDVAPETVELDEAAYMRLRSRGDRRPASEPQIRRVFALARAAGLTGPDGRADRERVLDLVDSVAGTRDVDALTREQVQIVYDELEQAAEHRRAAAQATPA